jgi:excisionase family DNA binding protein
LQNEPLGRLAYNASEITAKRMQRRPEGLINIDEVLEYLNQDRYMSKTEAAKYLSVSPRTLEAKKDIPRFRLRSESGRGGKVLFRKTELDRWMETNRVACKDHLDLSKIADEALRAVIGNRKRRP